MRCQSHRGVGRLMFPVLPLGRSGDRLYAAGKRCIRCPCKPKTRERAHAHSRAATGVCSRPLSPTLPFRPNRWSSIARSARRIRCISTRSSGCIWFPATRTSSPFCATRQPIRARPGTRPNMQRASTMSSRRFSSAKAVAFSSTPSWRIRRRILECGASWKRLSPHTAPRCWNRPSRPVSDSSSNRSPTPSSAMGASTS